MIVVDDGLATGLTDLAAVRALRARGAGADRRRGPGRGARVGGARRRGGRRGRLPHDPARAARGRPLVPRLLAGLRCGGESRCSAPRRDVRRPGVPPPSAGAPIARGRCRASCCSTSAALRSRATSSIPAEPRGLVIFAHGSGSSRLSPRNRAVAATLNEAGFATLLFDLLTSARRAGASSCSTSRCWRAGSSSSRGGRSPSPTPRGLPVGYFGASTGAAAALRAAAAAGEVVRAVVSRGGRPDLAADRLAVRDCADAADRRQPRPRGARAQPPRRRRCCAARTSSRSSKGRGTCSPSRGRSRPSRELAGGLVRRRTSLLRRRHWPPPEAADHGGAACASAR